MKDSGISDRKIVVVGGGIIGLAIADALCRQGLMVTVLERDRIAQGTTSKSFAWINATSKTRDEAYHRLNAAGLGAWRDRAREFGEVTIGLHPRGMVEWVDGDDDQAMAALSQTIARLAAWNYPAHPLDRAELAALEPHFAFPANARGVHALGDASLDAPRAAMHFADCVRANGGHIVEHCSARAIRRTNGAIDGVESDTGLVPAEQVIIAAGYETNAVVAKLTGNDAFESRGPVGAVPGALVQTPPASTHCWVRHVVYCEHRGPLHLQPTPDGGLLLGGDDTDNWIANGYESALLERIEGHLLERAQKLIPGLPVSDWRGRCAVRVGVRPMPADGHSIVGELPGNAGIFLAATHSGITLAPIIGALLAERIVSGSTPAMIEPFHCQRFQTPG